jgi:hypothetical protein
MEVEIEIYWVYIVLEEGVVIYEVFIWDISDWFMLMFPKDQIK